MSVLGGDLKCILTVGIGEKTLKLLHSPNESLGFQQFLPLKKGA